MKLVLIGDAVSGVQTVVDVLIPAEGMNVDQTFPPDVLEAAKQAPDDVDRGWLTKDGGRSFEAPPAPTPEPQPITSVTSAQAKIQLRRAGLRDKVDAAIQAADGEVQDWFTDARVWERDNPHVVDIGTSLGLKPADIDALFEAAAQISV
jgi:hypothetical protein